MRRSTAELVLAAVVLLAATGCGQAPELPPAGAEGGELRIWRPGAALPTRIRAVAVRQPGPDPRQLELEGVAAMVPLDDGRCHLAAPSGRYDALATTRLGLDGPVALHGWGAGGPFTGTAGGARVVGPERELVLDDVALVHAGQLQRMGHLVLPSTWGGRRFGGSGHDLRSEPAPPLWVAALAALPAAPPDVVSPQGPPAAP